MAKFLGVISNSAPKPSEGRVLEYTDLELLYEYLLSETQNLFSDFLEKVKFMNEREIMIHENAGKFQHIYEYFNNIRKKSIEVENEADDVGRYLGEMEKTINLMDKIPNDISACKCMPNMDRKQTLDMIIQLAENFHQIEQKVEQVKEEKNNLPIKDPFDMTNRLLPFLDLHTKILQQIDQKICGISELLNEVDQMFLNVHKRLIGAYSHKVNHGSRHSEC